MDQSHYTPMPAARLIFLSLILSCILLITTPAVAGTIMNLSDEPQTIEVRTASGYEAEIIKPDRAFTTTSDVDIRFRGADMRIINNMNYAIWPDGNIGPQGQAGGGNKN